MKTTDVYTISLQTLLAKAWSCRSSPSNPATESTITIPRHVFDDLVAVVEATSRIGGGTGIQHTLTAETTEDGWVVNATNLSFGNVESRGRTLFEALATLPTKIDEAIQFRFR